MDFKEQEPFLPSGNEKFDTSQDSDIEQDSLIPNATQKAYSRRRIFTRVLTQVGLFIIYCIAT
jgi:hypothetical protein